MGWDAYATDEIPTGDNAIFKAKTDGNIGIFIPNKELKKAFSEASEQVKKKAKTVDFMLEYGGLDCSACAFAMQNITGCDAWGHDLSPDEVAALPLNTYKPAKSDAWAYWSALYFLKICKKFKVGIKFSW